MKRRKYDRPCFLLICSLLTFLSSVTVQAQREMKTINSGWSFAKGERPDSTRFVSVSIPHTWNTDAYTDKKYDRGIGWYRKILTLSSHWKGKQLFLRFEGVSKSAEVYVNGQLAGQHKGGYTAFTLNITRYCSFTSPNQIAVRVDNASEDVAPISGDFTFFGGIYRDVWLIALSEQHFSLDNCGSDRIFISTPKVSEAEGTLVIKGAVQNTSSFKTEVEVVHTLYTPEGKALQQLRRKIKMNSGEEYHFQETPAPVRHPQLWSPETPSLYRMETTLLHCKTGQILDQLNQTVGFRWFHFDGEKGFSLNGKPYKLNGVCRHQDQKPIGTALSDEMHRRDMKLMKEMGANFIRISHYPQDPAILEQCDRLGMLAWEEIPIIDIVPESEAYGDNCEQNLREMVRQHYNHPSIVLWGYMNEILLVTQRRYKTPETQQPVLNRTLALAKRLEKVLREEDPYRNSVMAFHGSDSYNTVGLGNITDVVGWNLYSGWYGGNLNGFEQFLANQHRNHPTHPLIVSEYGAGSDRRIHSLQPESFDFSIEYQQKYLEHYLPVISNTPYICGGTHWNFIDFSSALRDESMPRINNKGLVYSDRTPKDIFYYYKAMFRKDTPVLHIASRDWTRRAGIIRMGEKTAVQPVKIYTNLPQVELWIDGQSLGTKKSENCTVVFEVPFKNGYQFLRAVTPDGTEDGLSIHFTSIPAQLTEENLEGLELAVNVGSKCFFTSDESQLTWIPDQVYTKGGWGYIDEDLSSQENKAENTQTEIINTTDGPLYQTLRSGLKGYRFDVPEGRYEVELLLADIYQKKEELPYQLGRQGESLSWGNSFHIVINDVQVEENCCVSKEAGAFHAVKKRFVVLVGREEKKIEVRLETVNGKNFLNGIKIRKL